MTSVIIEAIGARQSLLDEAHEAAARLFSGFSEGCPELVIDLYGSTVVLHNYADPPEGGIQAIEAATTAVATSLPWIRTTLIKRRNSAALEERLGILGMGELLQDRVREASVCYAIDLRLHQDCSLYLDTRNVRTWAMENLRDCTVLNAFAYTGSLGVAGLAGGAQRVDQVDRSKTFLDVARRSYALNHFPIRKQDFLAEDFFRVAARLRREHRTFECVFLDPPFFSSGPSGIVDQESGAARLINKARPLVSPGGRMVAINNAVYVSGADHMRALEALCADGYMEIEELLPIPADFVGMIRSPRSTWIADPAPFNHSTKIAVLRVRA
ncbi:MAG TPA: class I SAM-dependent methyltransferase [Anaerolineales bacterium]|nr:class I SAM-dependent methyltransferase [Anaerolineales bacterium]